MKNLVHNAAIAALIFATTMMSTIKANANNYADTVIRVNSVETEISPESEDALVEEDALEIEGWMFEKINIANEEVINLEAWMFESFNNANEEVLNVENWMFETLTVPAEEVLNVEDWMFDSTIGEIDETPLQLESWMF